MSSGVHALALVACLGAAARPVLSAPPAGDCRPADLPGLTSRFDRARREARGQMQAPPAGLTPGAAADFWRVTRAVLGPAAEPLESTIAADARGWPTVAAVPCTAEIQRRDSAAWRLTLAGYSAREIADVLEEHLTVGDLDEAHRRLMSGQPRDTVAAFLEARWREPGPVPTDEGGPAFRGPALDLGALEDDLATLSHEHGVAAGLVRAVIAAESAGNPRAVSPVGAIGLMQLMPGTAAALGVDPWSPRDNLRGGIAYLASLLRDFDGNTRLALIAYNAGPSHARDVRAGRAVAYRETRRYLDAIDARYPLP